MATAGTPIVVNTRLARDALASLAIRGGNSSINDVNFQSSLKLLIGTLKGRPVDEALFALAVALIGSDVLLPGGKVIPVAGKLAFGYRLAREASIVDIDIVGQDGTVLRTTTADTEAGGHAGAWDVVADDGAPLRDGIYRLRVSARDADGTVVKARAYTYARLVDAASDGQGKVTVWTADGRVADFLEVLSVRGAGE